MTLRTLRTNIPDTLSDTFCNPYTPAYYRVSYTRLLSTLVGEQNWDSSIQLWSLIQSLLKTDLLQHVALYKFCSTDFVQHC